MQELSKQIGWAERKPSLYHFRLHTGPEADFVLEDAAGQVAGVEVKAAATVGKADFKGLEALRAAAGERFRRGVVLYTGDEVVPFGERMCAAPVETLWSEPAAADAG